MWTKNRATVASVLWVLFAAALFCACDSQKEAPPAPQQPHPGQPGYPQQQASPAQQVQPGQQVPGQVAPGQPVPGQPVAVQQVPGQPVPGQPVPGQPVPGQPGAQPQNPLGQMLNALGQAAGQTPPVPAQNFLPWDSLSKALPVNAAGWTLDGQIEGESSTMMGVSVSKSNCRLKQGDMTAKVEILDTSMNPMLAMPFNMARSLRKDSSSERVGPINFGTYPGTQTFHKKSNRAEITVLVKNRLLVTISVTKAASEAPAVALAQQVNYPVLEKLLGN